MPPIQRAFSSLGCPQLSVREILALAARHGIGAVELRAANGSVDLPASLAAEFGSPAAFADYVAKQNVRIVALGASLYLPGDDDARTALLRYVPWAEALGGVRLRIFDGAAGHDANTLAASVATLQWWRDLRVKNNWRSDVMIETHSSLLTASVLARFLAAAPASTAILWDTHHTWRAGGETPGTTWPVIAKNTVHMHVKDSISTLEDAKERYRYTLPGAGEYPIAALLNILKQNAFAGPVSLEWEKQWHPELPSLENALVAATEKLWW